MNAVALQRQVGYRLHQLGVTGSLGLAMLLLAVLAWFTLVRSGEKEIVSLQHKQQDLQRQAFNKSSLPVRSALDREEQLRVFYKSFAPTDQLPDTLSRIYSAAAKQDLVLETGEYTRLQTGSERLARFRVAFPVKGSFKQLLGFMDAVLLENKSVALENAAFKRDKVDDEAVEAKLVFLVFMDTQP
jgi:Tfp pilus assembly protein PilO